MIRILAVLMVTIGGVLVMVPIAMGASVPLIVSCCLAGGGFVLLGMTLLVEDLM